MTSWRPLHELVAATHTPFHADGSLAPEVVPTQAAFLAANGIRTVFVTGSTGECHALTSRRTPGPLRGLGDGRARRMGCAVIAHVGGNALEDVRALGAQRRRRSSCRRSARWRRPTTRRGRSRI